MVTQMGPYVKVTGLGGSDLVKSRIIDKFEAWGPNANPVRREAGVGIPRRRPAARGHGVCRDRQHNGVDGALMSGRGAVRTAGTVVGGLRARSWADCGHGRGRTPAALRVRG